MKFNKKMKFFILILVLCITCVPNVVLASSGKLTLKAKVSGSSAIKLSWNKVRGTKMYVISVNQKGKKVTKIKVASKKTNYTIKKISGKKLVEGKTYVASITAFKDKKCKRKIKTSKKVSVTLPKPAETKEDVKEPDSNIKPVKEKEDAIKQIEDYAEKNKIYATLLARNEVLDKVINNINSQNDIKSIEDITCTAIEKLTQKKEIVLEAGEKDLKTAKEMALIQYFVREGKYDISKIASSTNDDDSIASEKKKKINLEECINNIDGIIQREENEEKKAKHEQFVEKIKKLTLENDYANELGIIKKKHKLDDVSDAMETFDVVKEINALQDTLELSSVQNESAANVYASVKSDDMIGAAEECVDEIQEEIWDDFGSNNFDEKLERVWDLVGSFRDEEYLDVIFNCCNKILSIAGLKHINQEDCIDLPRFQEETLPMVYENVDNEKLKEVLHIAFVDRRQEYLQPHKAYYGYKEMKKFGVAPAFDLIVDGATVDIARVQIEQKLKTVDEVKEELKALLIGCWCPVDEENPKEFQVKFEEMYGLSDLVREYEKKIDDCSEDVAEIIDVYIGARVDITRQVYMEIMRLKVLDKTNAKTIDETPFGFRHFYKDICNNMKNRTRGWPAWKEMYDTMSCFEQIYCEGDNQINSGELWTVKRHIGRCTICSIDAEAAVRNGYEFFDEDGKKIEGDLTVDSLRNACWYCAKQEPAKKVVYAYAHATADYFKPWKETGFYWSQLSEISGVTNDGMKNTELMIDKHFNDECSIWKSIAFFQEWNGCDEWYIGTVDEMKELLQNSIVDIGDSDLTVWTSTEKTKDTAYALVVNSKTKKIETIELSKNDTSAVIIPIRSF